MTPLQNKEYKRKVVLNSSFSILNGNVLGSKTLQVFFCGLKQYEVNMKQYEMKLLCRLVVTCTCGLLP